MVFFDIADTATVLDGLLGEQDHVVEQDLVVSLENSLVVPDNLHHGGEFCNLGGHRVHLGSHSFYVTANLVEEFPEFANLVGEFAKLPVM